MVDDPYTVLGLPRAATEDDIRRAFRKLAKELHPDIRPGDKASAERFKKVAGAYEILGDAEKRRQFDRGEIDANGDPQRSYERHASTAGGSRGRPGAGGGAGPGVGPDFGFGDVFSDLFGGGRGPGGPRGAGFSLKGQDARYTLEVEFLEAVLGAKKRVTMPDGAALDLNVPAGVTDGQVLRLKGKGGPGIRGGEPGDAMVEIRVRPHPEFRREGDDILLDVPVTLDEAVLGARIEVPTTSGRVALAIPKGTNSGRAFRLKGKGANNPSTGVTGDQIVTVRIELPPVIDESLAYFLTEWKKKNGYSVRD